MVRSRRFALSLVCIVLLTSAVVPARAENTYWQHDPSSPSDWFAPGNWTVGVPDSTDSAIIDNGGTADISSGQATAKYVRVGCDNKTGTMTHAGGDLVVKEDISIGLYSGAVGTYVMSGSARLSADCLFVGHSDGMGHFIQTGGTNEALQIFVMGDGTSSYELSGTGVINSNHLSAGSFVQTGGTVNLVYGLGVSGTYELSGTGQIYAKDETISTYGGASMNQTGGVNTVTGTIRLGEGGGNQGTYNLSGTGELAVAEMYLGTTGGIGVFQQSGGIATIGYMSVNYWDNPNRISRVELSGGSLRINQAMFLKGDLDFTADGGTFEVAEDAFVDLSQGNIQNPGNGSILGGLNSLTIFPTGFDPIELKSYSTAGMTHIAGNTLLVPTGKKVTGRGEINDHVICQGQISTHEGASLDLNSGLEVSNGGTVNLGDYGELTVKDSTSGISDGSILLDEMWVGKSDVAGTFTQSGGTVVGGEFFIGYEHDQNGTYVLRGTGELTAGIEWIGKYSTGSFVQEAGTHNADSVYLAGGQDTQATYEMSGGQLNATYLWVADHTGSTATFTQTDGVVTVNESMLLGISGGSGTYTLAHGDVLAGSERIGSVGRFCQSGGTNTVGYLHILNGGRYEYTGGTLNIGAWDIQGELDFTGTTATVYTAEGGILDFRRLAPGSICNSEEVSLVGVPNSLIIKEEGFDPESLFKSFTTTGLVHTAGETLLIPAGVNLIFSGVHSNERAEFEDHLQCSGSLVIPDENPYKGLDLMDGLEITSGGHVDLGSGHVFVNDLVSGISSGQLSNRNYARLWIGLTQDGKFTQTGGTVSVGDLYLGGNGNSGAYYMSDGELEAVAETVGQSDSPAYFYQSGGTNTFDSLSLKGGPYYSPNATYTLSGNAVMNGRALAVGVGYYLPSGTSFYHQNGTVNLEILTVAGGTYTLDSGSLTSVDEDIRGRFYHKGGTNEITETLTVKGCYYLYNGELYADTESLKGGSITQAGGTNTVQSDLNVAEDGNSTYVLTAGTLSAENETIGVVWGIGKFVQSGGSNTVGSTLRLGESNKSHGTYELKAGNLIAHTVEVGYGYVQYPGNTGTFNHSGGTNMISGSLFLGYNTGASGTYTIGNANLGVSNFYVGYDGSGTLNITNTAANITVSNLLQFGADSTFIAVPGATIHMTGSAFKNQSTDPDALAGLANLTLIFEGGTEDIDPFEAAGEDMGAVFAGLESNFALGTLQLGGADIGQLQLVDLFDNQPGWEGSEALYVENLILGAGSTLDLNGLNLYYLNFTDYGGTVTGGTPTQVPEPASVLLLALGACLPLLRKHR